MEKIDEEFKQRFRDEKCNIAEMFKNKAANIPKDSKLLVPLQSEEEFEKLLYVKNWAVTQTVQSNIIFTDLDENKCHDSLGRFFNRSRDKYENHSEHVNSKHGFIKITDATHEECVKFANRFHNKVGIEIYAENHWVIFAGTYYNNKNIDNPKRETTWYRIDDLHVDPIIEFTKEEIGSVFMKIPIEDSKNSSGEKIPAGKKQRHEGIVNLLYEKLKTLKKNNDTINQDVLYSYIINESLIQNVTDYVKGNSKYEELEKIIKWIISVHENKLLEEKEKKNIFAKACKIFENQLESYEYGLAVLLTKNQNSDRPLEEQVLTDTVKAAYDTVQKKLDAYSDDEQIIQRNPAKIDLVADMLMNKHDFVTQSITEKILLYDGKIYSNTLAEKIIKEKTEKIIQYCTKNNVNEVIHKIKRRTFVDINSFDADPNKLTINNGILNIEEQKLYEHTPDNKSQVLVPIDYHPPTYPINQKTIFEDIEKNLQNTMFYQYLKRSFTIDNKFRKQDFEMVLCILASVFIKKQIDQKAFIFLGGGENGKSILLDYIASLLGVENTSHIPLHELSDDKFMGAELHGICANIFSDLEDDELKRTGKIKGIIAGEGLKVQRKYEKPFDLYPFCKLLFSCNRFPKVYDQSQGFFRRWIIVKWERNFENDPERIPDLLLKLSSNQDEKSKVFSALIPLVNKIKLDGVFKDVKPWKDTQKEWNENADPIGSFITNFIIEDYSHGARKTKITTFQFYKNKMFELGENPLSIGKFGREFGEMFDDSKVDGIRYWLNIDFRIPKQTQLRKTTT